MEKGEVLTGNFAARPVPGSAPGRLLDVSVDINLRGAAARVAYAMRRPLQRS
jgi:hypothetical protein